MEELLNEILQELKKLNEPKKMVYSTREVAELLHTNEHKVSALRRTGILVPIKMGAEYCYPKEELDKFLKNYKGADLSNEKTMISESKKRKTAMTTNLARFSCLEN